MKLNTFEAVITALHKADIRYLIAGGMAVNAHGYLRMSQDIDIVIALNAGNIHNAFAALMTEGYRPLVPITSAQFANEEQRREWVEKKGMKVLNFFSDTHPETPVDVFVYEPFDFDREFDRALKGELLPGLPTYFVSIPALIQMKQAAGRPKDLDDIEHLTQLLTGPDTHE
jgi:hypothetical protein